MEQIGRELFRSMMGLMQSLKDFSSAGPVTKSTMLLLFVIHQEAEQNVRENGIEGVTSSHLSSTMEVTKPAVSKAVSCLEERGFVERVNDELDRRRVYIRLTPEGERILEEARRSMLARIDRIVQKLGEQEAQEFIRLSRSFSQICQQMQESANIY
ncbi:MarR family winged helix-turn-helix transcriptional regulator [Anaeromassilibacillus senegalensis]|uniref:MarR family winged helix-turn-helix transcriptional regulator n=1 Tax=Anaeromassilibacillus senegalensis TaxID=1673717 RepID=UPI00068037EE|nr:MarR family transcriptional regulator [Anaeromassilibacillus senegalensis]